MKRITMLIIATLFFLGAANNINAQNENSLIRIRMNFIEIEKNLNELGAKETQLSIAYPEGYGQITDLKVYTIPNIKPFIIIEYLLEDKSITGLTLYYEYKHKMDPDNKWLNVEEVDLKKLNP